MAKWLAIASILLLGCYGQPIKETAENLEVADSLYKKAVPFITKNQLHQKDDELAFDLLNRAVILDPSNMAYRLDRAAVKINLLLFEEAIDDLEKVLRRDSNNVFALLNVALCYNHLEMYDRSLEYSTKAIQIHPSFGYAYFIRSDSHLYKNELDKMCSDLNKAFQYKYAPAANRISRYCNQKIKNFTF